MYDIVTLTCAEYEAMRFASSEYGNASIDGWLRSAAYTGKAYRMTLDLNLVGDITDMLADAFDNAEGDTRYTIKRALVCILHTYADSVDCLS